MSINIKMFSISQLPQTSYEKALQIQMQLRDLRRQNKIENTLLLVSHPPVFTLGKRDCREDFLSSSEEIEKEGIQIFQTNRGGRITYHGPGQIVGYFIVDIRSIRLSIPGFVRHIEELLIKTIENYDLKGTRDSDYPGVWVKDKKIAAIGLHFDRGVSMHGFALNVHPDLSHYRHIIPCGIRDRKVTSMELELRQNVSIQRVKEKIIQAIPEVFDNFTIASNKSK